MQLPPLAIAIDDSLMALVERCVSLFAPHNSPSQQAQANQTAAFHAGPFSSNLGSSPDGRQQVGAWMSSASSPMTLLEQARQAQRLNQVLDSITSPSRAPGKPASLSVLTCVHMMVQPRYARQAMRCTQHASFVFVHVFMHLLVSKNRLWTQQYHHMPSASAPVLLPSLLYTCFALQMQARPQAL